MATKEIIWTQSQKGKVQHAYRNGQLLGFIMRVPSPIPGIAYSATRLTARGNVSCGMSGAQTAEQAAAMARTLLETSCL